VLLAAAHVGHAEGIAGLLGVDHAREVVGARDRRVPEPDDDVADPKVRILNQSRIGPVLTGVEVRLDDPFDAKRVGRVVAGRLGFPYWVRDWMDMNRNLFAALQLEKLALFVIVTIIVLVAAFAIIRPLVLPVSAKRKDIGVLKSLGASAPSITAIFFTVGMTIGVVGTAAGSAVGLALIWIQNTYKIIRLAGDVYQIDYLPMKLSHGDFILVISATLAISFLATIFPARRAGSLAPVDVLRYA